MTTRYTQQMADDGIEMGETDTVIWVARMHKYKSHSIKTAMIVYLQMNGYEL